MYSKTGGDGLFGQCSMCRVSSNMTCVLKNEHALDRRNVRKVRISCREGMAVNDVYSCRSAYMS